MPLVLVFERVILLLCDFQDRFEKDFKVDFLLLVEQ